MLTSLMNLIGEMLQGWVISNIENMLYTLNNKIATLGTDIAISPSEYQGGDLWSIIESIANQVALPIAGTVFVFVVTWELIQLLITPNNLSDIDFTSVLMKWLIKSVVAAWFIANSLVICNCFFAIGADMILKTNRVIGSTTPSLDSYNQLLLNFMDTYFKNPDYDFTPENIGNLISLGLATTILNLVFKVLSIVLVVIIHTRMITIYLHCSVAPIPLATITSANHELSGMGYNFSKSVFALAVQGVLMMIIIAIYAALLVHVIDPSSLMNNGFTMYEALNTSLWECVGLSVVLVMCLLKSGEITKSIFGVH